MNDERDVANVWDVLRSSETSVEQQISAAPLGVSVSAGPILAGIDAHSNRYVLFPLLAGEALAVDKAETLVRLVRLRHRNRDYAGVVCLSREVDDVFAQFARELVTALQTSRSPAKDCVVALRNWRKLFSNVTRVGALTEEEQIGLFGELTSLNQILDRVSLSNTEIWTGPDRSQHDFRGLGVAIEVKTSRARDGRRVRVHGVEQLNSPPGSDLYLAYHRVEREPGGQTLPSLIHSTFERGIDPDIFAAQLASCGYRETDSSDYQTPYRVVESRLHIVDVAEFPKITPSSFENGEVPSGVESINYIIDLSNEPPFPLSESEAATIYLRLASS